MLNRYIAGCALEDDVAEEAEDDSPTVHPFQWSEFRAPESRTLESRTPEPRTPEPRTPKYHGLSNIIRRALNCVCYGNSISCAINLHTVIRPQVTDLLDA